MASKKITVTLPEELVDEAKELAKDEGIALSTFVAEATAKHTRIKAGLAAMRELDEELGPPSPEAEQRAQEIIARIHGQPTTEETRRAS